MAKFNRPGVRAKSEPTTKIVGQTVNHEGGTGFLTDTRSELFRLATVNFVGEDSFYESAGDRDSRYNELVRHLAIADFDWLAGMLGWLRSKGNMRSASLVGAAEAVHVSLAEGMYNGNAELIDSVLQRADEPGEFLAYWISRFGRSLPKAVRKGVAMAVVRLYNEKSFSKWDSAKRGFRFADVLELIHPKPKDAQQEALFKFILDDRHHGDAKVNEHLPVLSARQRLTSMPVADRRALLKRADAVQKLRAAGMTWESVGGWLQGEMDRTAWEAIAPTMGYMALLRNLRGLDEAGIDNRLARKLADKIADPDEVAKSRQLPFRFLTAYLNAPSDRWKQALTEAADHALKNIPALDGRTLVLVDTSASMSHGGFSAKSKVTPAMAGALFGVALALRNQGDLYGFANGVFAHRIQRNASVLAEANRFVGRIGEVGHGTEMTRALRQAYAGHKRVVVVTDMQCFADGGSSLSDGGYRWGGRSANPIPVPDGVPVYGFNLGGYKTTAVDTRIAGRHELSGLTDATFAQIRNLEAGASGSWPWTD